ncbi:adhesin [Sporosarcina sp. NCCP-2716]|uniref:metal ABC transporter solute-binding protein, Zn/Mn family n=1 Tax=Sporosarcina sp. NCCP-2716 TaxID=2943679 RepID=UPI00203ACC5D|nr:zinc ABC transporter substrate-binding protein [Sporosarcina sp. NCCP-2716]GKV69421.1 adhesin [Sporosarcina sp. NCCP-2716]
MKNRYWLTAVSVLLLLALSACGKKGESSATDDKEGKMTVYTTVYPLQYFAERIGGDTVEAKSIYPAGTDEHTFDPTQKEMMKLADADLFFYIGLGLEGFVENAEKTLDNQHVKMVAASKAISPDKLMKGHAHEDDEDGHGHGEIDPHVWISPVLSIPLAEAVRDGLTEQAPGNKELYDKNFNELKGDLEQLDRDYAQMSEKAASKTFFVSHAAYGYLAEQYGLEQVAIAGLNTQNEPSQKELASIVAEAKEKHVKTVLFEQNVSSKLTEVVQKEIGADSAVLHNLSVLTPEDENKHEDYFTLQHRNIKVLEKALNE